MYFYFQEYKTKKPFILALIKDAIDAGGNITHFDTHFESTTALTPLYYTTFLFVHFRFVQKAFISHEQLLSQL